MSTQTICNAAALDFFTRQFHHLESTTGLVRAAIGISMHALDDVDPNQVEDHIFQLARRVKQRVRGRQLQAKLAHLHEVLFEEEGFFGNTTHYYSPLNSYLPAVLESHLGIPITLALVYKAVAEHLGIRVVGLNTPYHFLVEVRDEGERMIVDPFLGGRVLTHEDVRKLLFEARPRHNSRSPQWEDPDSHPAAEGRRMPAMLPIASHRQWLARILANLQHVFGRHGFCADHAAMTELQQRLDQQPLHRGEWV